MLFNLTDKHGLVLRTTWCSFDFFIFRGEVWGMSVRIKRILAFKLTRVLKILCPKNRNENMNARVTCMEGGFQDL